MKMFNVIRSRWRNAMPRFFKRLMWLCGLISGTALAANEAMQVAGIEPHQWWIDVRPYLISVPAGAMFACKFTQRYDDHGQPIEGADSEKEPHPAGGYTNNCDVIADNNSEI